VRAEKNIDLFLNHHAYKVDAGKGRLEAVYAFDTRTSRHTRFAARLFADCTGHGTIGHLAGAHLDMTPKGRMGMSNMWAWDERDEARSFPKTPWALDLEMKDFPYPRAHHGQWFWEGGFDKDAIGDAEGIRDWNLRAVFGAFNAMKNRDGADKHRNAFLTWVAYIGGPRESRRLMGDVVLTEEDIVKKRDFPDGCVPSTWSIDLHYPKEQYAKKYPDNPFISIAKHNRAVDRAFGYPVPYRCFYSRNIENLFMAGRNISVTHEALGTTRVMKTCGMMGEVVGKAASICIDRQCKPRDVYTGYLDELKRLLHLPGKARRLTVSAKIIIPKNIPPPAGPHGPMSGQDPAKLAGIVIDDPKAKKIGIWNRSGGLKNYVGYGYLYAGGGSGAAIEFEFQVPKSGNYEVRVAYGHHPNRCTRVPVTVHSADGQKAATINMSQPAPLNGFISLGTYPFVAGRPGMVRIDTVGVKGAVHTDAIQVLPIKP